jgi:hypothetical protein
LTRRVDQGPGTRLCFAVPVIASATDPQPISPKLLRTLCLRAAQIFCPSNRAAAELGLGTGMSSTSSQRFFQVFKILQAAEGMAYLESNHRKKRKREKREGRRRFPPGQAVTSRYAGLG